MLDFHTKSQILNQDLRRGENTLEKGADGERAVTRDFDGNMLEAVYDRKRDRAGGRREPVIELETASTEKEARRVLQWQEDVARSIVNTERSSTRSEAGPEPTGQSPPKMRRADSYPLPVREREREGHGGGTRMVRRETITTTTYGANHPAPAPAPSQKKEPADTGSGNAILGSLLGVAAVAGFAAYALSSHRSASPEPIPARRASDVTRGAAPSYVHPPQHSGLVQREEIRETRSVAVPARSYVSERGHGCEMERVQPSYVQYTVSTPAPARELERIDERSYHSSRAPSKVDSGVGRYERERERERERDQRPMTIVPESEPRPIRERERERDLSPSRESLVSKRSYRSHRSHKSSTSRSPRDSDRDRDGSEKTYHSRGDRDQESSYTTARSHHSSSTVKAREKINVKPEAPVPPPAASLVSTSTVRMEGSGRERRRKSSHAHQGSPTSHSHYSTSPPYREREPRHVPLPESVFSDRTARQVPLPESIAGHSEWERGSVRMVQGLGREYNEYRADGGGLEGLEGLRRADGGGGGGYAASVAPSDSISSVGIKKERERLRDRLRERDRGVVGGWEGR